MTDLKSIIFDLDLTLVDLPIGEKARKRLEWQDFYSWLPRITLYSSLESMFEYLPSNGIKVAIESTALTAYVQRIVSLFNIPNYTIVGYRHVTKYHRRQ